MHNKLDKVLKLNCATLKPLPEYPSLSVPHVRADIKS